MDHFNHHCTHICTVLNIKFLWISLLGGQWTLKLAIALDITFGAFFEQVNLHWSNRKWILSTHHLSSSAKNGDRKVNISHRRTDK